MILGLVNGPISMEGAGPLGVGKPSSLVFFPKLIF